jgi:hypothetical protein
MSCRVATQLQRFIHVHYPEYKTALWISGLTRNQLAIFDSLAPQAAEDGDQPENPENGVPR